MPGDGEAGTGQDTPKSGAKTYTQAELDAEVAGLKGKNGELLGKLKDLQAALEPWKGLDAAAVKEALAARTKAEEDAQRKSGDWDAREKSLRDGFKLEHDKVVGPLQERVTGLERELFEAVAVRDALEAINLAGVKGNPKLLLPILRPELGVVEVDGQRVTVVKGSDGKPRYHPTTNALVTVEDRLKELRAIPDYAGAFEGAPGSGSGARASGTSGSPPVVAASDSKAFLANLAQIAKGEVTVQ